jgi:hypothetical protein
VNPHGAPLVYAQGLCSILFCSTYKYLSVNLHVNKFPQTLTFNKTNQRTFSATSFKILQNSAPLINQNEKKTTNIRNKLHQLIYIFPPTISVQNLGRKDRNVAAHKVSIRLKT